MPPARDQGKQGVGATKWIGIVSAVVTLVAAVLKLPPNGGVLLCSILFGCVVLYSVYDICSWYWFPGVWVFGIVSIAVTVYWWVSFLARHNIPQRPLLPAWAALPNWGYLLLLAYLLGYCAWDMADAIHMGWRDKEDIMVLGSCVIVELFALVYFTWAA